MNAHQRRKGQRAQKRFLETKGFTVQSYVSYWNDDGYQAAKMIDSAFDRKLVAELAKTYPNANVLRIGYKKHPDDRT